jgi:hypothetical protein
VYREVEKATQAIKGFDQGLQDFHNAVETIMNIHYLIELDSANLDNIRQYLRLADPALDTLLRISRAGEQFRQGIQV